MSIEIQKHNSVKTVILALLLSRKGGCTLAQLDADYYEQEGEYIPWRALGHVSLLSFLQSIPKTVQIENRGHTLFVKGIPSEKSKHVSKLVDGQKSQTKRPMMGRKTFRPSHYFPQTAYPRVRIPADILTKIINKVHEHPDGVNKDYILSMVQSQMSYAHVTMNDLEDQMHELSHKVIVKDNKMFPVQNKTNSNRLWDMFSNTKEVKTQFTESLGYTPHKQERKSPIIIVGGDEDSDNMSDANDYDDDFHFTPSNYTQKPVDANSYEKTEQASSFIKDTICMYQDDMATHNTLYSTSKEQIEQNGVNNIDNYNDDYEVQEERSKHDNNDCADILISDRIKFRLEKLIQNHPDGIWCANLPEKYLEEYKVHLNYTELGFHSVREFASHLPEVFHCVQFHDTGDFILYNAKNELPSNQPKDKQTIMNLTDHYQIYLNEDVPAAIPATVSLDTCRGLIPDTVMTINECVGQISVTDLASDEKPYIEVVVEEVFTPSFFWIQLRKKQQAFKKFMTDINNYYTEQSSKYGIPPVVLEKGLNCACKYEGVWHRGIIKSVNPDLRVTVMFYDYGTLKTYEPDEIHYLHRKFAYLQAQAIPCGLINTRPRNTSKWSRNATHQFTVRSSGIPLIATIASINTEDNSMMVTLTDTLEEEDVHLNDWMVEQKLAEHGKLVCMKSRNFPFHCYLKCHRSKKNRGVPKLNSALKSHGSLAFEDDLKSKITLYDSFINVEQTRRKVDSENVSSVRNICSDTRTPKSKAPKRLMPLYEKQLTITNKSYSKQNTDSRLVPNEKWNVTPSYSVCPLKNEVSKCDSVPYNISEEPSSKFRIRSSDEESLRDFKCFGSCPNTCKGDHEVPYVDWSEIRDSKAQKIKSDAKSIDLSMMKENQKPFNRTRANLPKAEECFMKAVRSCSNYSPTQIRWLPAGNINKAQDTSAVILRKIKERVSNEDTVVTLPEDIYEALKHESAENDDVLSSTSQDVRETESTNSREPNSTTENTSFSSNVDTINKISMENVHKDSVSVEQNYYTYVTIGSSKLKKLQMMLEAKNMSRSTSVLDSDDLSYLDNSINETQTLSGQSTDSEVKHQITKDLKPSFDDFSIADCENDAKSESNLSVDEKCVNIDEITSDNCYSEIVKKELSVLPLDTENSDSCVTDSEIKNVSDKEQIAQDLVKEILQESTAALEVDVPVYKTLESMDEKTEIGVAIKELQIERLQPQLDTSIPVFNDENLKFTEDEEWDAYVSYNDICKLLKNRQMIS